MKRLTNIEIENFRAFSDNYRIELPNSENLLVYGENGSGKSSLFKALENYLASSRNIAFPFITNHHLQGNPGNINLTFSDVDPITKVLIPGTQSTYNFGNIASTHNVAFVQDAALIKGFLDYRNLLDVYNHKEPNPNLFGLIVNELLLDRYPVGGVEPLGRKYLRLSATLKSARTRLVISHRNALAELPSLHVEITDTLRRIFTKVNDWLPIYFNNSLTVDFALLPLTFNYDNWSIVSDLKLTLRLNGVLITDHRDILNEARLSALAICIYLASVIENPQRNFDYKILFLDDIFIGLDSGNRLPILNILKSEFSDYQIFMTTYDRHWYELAQRYFNSHMPEKWAYSELYTTNETVGPVTFEKPILLPYEENFDKAVYYLHHKTKPDYPAAANYFRKSAEEIIKLNIPSHELREEDNSLIESFKLCGLVNSGLKFLDKIGANNALILQLKNALPTLLHPLSHYNLSAQVYKGELIEVQKLLLDLSNRLKQLQSTYRLFIPNGRMFDLTFTISAVETGHYHIYSKEAIYALKDAAGIVSLSRGQCHCKTCFITDGINERDRLNFNKNNPVAQYVSVEDSYDKIFNYINAMPAFQHIRRVPNNLTEFSYNNGILTDTLENHKAMIVW